MRGFAAAHARPLKMRMIANTAARAPAVGIEDAKHVDCHLTSAPATPARWIFTGAQP
jgi:hypothetical protein